ncbi:hypothetical protein A3842_02565 [Paenibacillus sp. P3E]|uniref:hypothetical protein n=1 Tax=Paenibacillus sp. P3E TaxID=1349435 RepID=UPI0009639EA6|nr:hypothetical protein [Paenibacillus sp. P3E]OKP92275.1 hypothetical protein A3842_02565 [Paenibacillus sp. P3E]
MSGRRPAGIIKAFKVLAVENYIQWSVSNPIQTAVILEGWERNVPYDTSLERGVQNGREGNNIDYWLYH